MAQTRFPKTDELPSHPELPDPLVMFNGDRVATKQQWFDKRRPELKELFQHYMYGYLPPPAQDRGQGRARGRQGLRRQGDAARGHDLLRSAGHAADSSAAGRSQSTQRAGAGLRRHEFSRQSRRWSTIRPSGCRRRGCPTRTPASRTIAPPRPAAARRWTSGRWSSRSIAATPWPRSTTATSIPDRADVREGIQPHLRNKDAKPGAARLGHHRRLGLGNASRRRLPVHGQGPRQGSHRRGRPFAAGQDGAAGGGVRRAHRPGHPAPSRLRRHRAQPRASRRIGQADQHQLSALVRRRPSRSSTTSTDKLPFDQNCLAALVAPRPVLFSNAVEDTWANPDGPVPGVASSRSGLSLA